TRMNYVLGMSIGIVLGLNTASAYNLVPLNNTSFATACKETDKTCDRSNLSNKTSACQFLKENPTYLCYVKQGFCKEHEFQTLMATECNVSSTTFNSSDAKNSFYNALANVSQNCQTRVVNSTYSSMIFTVLKSEEQFCLLINTSLNTISWESYVKNTSTNCSASDFQTLKNAACANNLTSVDQRFSRAILSSSMSCRSQLSQCTESNGTAKGLTRDEYYCQFLRLNESSWSTETCLRNNCTVDEFKRLMVAACGEGTTTPPTPKPLIQGTATTEGVLTTTSDARTLATSNVEFFFLSVLFAVLSKFDVTSL
ncbi:hypothetical protein BgiMline_017686, partial [Biomphalaria glabrata]